MNNTALQITDFDFYGDSLIAIQDNATDEVYTAINHVLRGIGFTERQVKHIHKKWKEDIIIAKGVQNFVLPSKSGNQDTTCISNRKLPIALTKITVTPKMKREQPELALKLELYQDKCADVLASVFIDRKTTDQINMQPLLDTLHTFTETVNSTLLSMNERINKLEEQQITLQNRIPKKRFSSWASKMFPKYQLLMDYFDISRKELYHNLYIELQNMYPNIDLAQEQDDYCYENGLDSCFTLDVIEYNRNLRSLFTSMVDALLIKYNLTLTENINNVTRQYSIFETNRKTEVNILNINSNDKWNQNIYESLYKTYHYFSDEELIEKWKYYQHNYGEDKYCNRIAISVCEDLLRQRGNTYLDDNYPRD